MTPRQARRERREADRKAKKLQLKKTRLAENNPASSEALLAIEPRSNPELADESTRELQIGKNARIDRPAANQPHTSPDGFVSQNGAASSTRAETNRKNAQLSTGPRSSDGKLASSRNSTKHGLASGQIIIPGEDSVAFEALLNDFLDEHQPATASEHLLIKEMAQSYWLTQRAIRFQNECFTATGVDQKQLALFLRYQTTHERAFYKALNTLLKLKKANRQNEIGFVSHQRPSGAGDGGFVSQAAAETHSHPQFVRQNRPGEVSESVVAMRKEGFAA